MSVRGDAGCPKSDRACGGERNEANSETAILTVEQFQQLWAELKEPFKTIALMCVCFGLRISECLGLGWSDVDWLNGKLNRTWHRRAKREYVKTDGSRRSLTVENELLQRLELWKRKTQFAGDSDWIFASPLKSAGFHTRTRESGEIAKAAMLPGWANSAPCFPTYLPQLARRSWDPIAVQQKLMPFGYPHHDEHLR